MIRYSISFSLADRMELSAGFNRQVLPLMRQAVKAVAQQATADWQEAVHRAKLWSGEKDAYANSIRWEMTGDFSAMVTADYRYAAEIEAGRPPRDLKKMLDTSLKVRRTESGKRFLVIPMRHNTAGNNAHARAMPSSVQALASGMVPSKIVGAGNRLSGEVTRLSPKTGMHAAADQTPYLSNAKTREDQTVARNLYSWGDRLTAGQIREAGLDRATARRYAGMVRMDASGSGRKSSTYLTFRIMMEGQNGWVVPAKPGLFLAKKVAEQLQPKAEAAFQEAIRRTLSKA